MRPSRSPAAAAVVRLRRRTGRDDATAGRCLQAWLGEAPPSPAIALLAASAHGACNQQAQFLLIVSATGRLCFEKIKPRWVDQNCGTPVRGPEPSL